MVKVVLGLLDDFSHLFTNYEQHFWPILILSLVLCFIYVFIYFPIKIVECC